MFPPRWRWDVRCSRFYAALSGSSAYIVPKRLYRTTTQRCVTSQKSADFMYTTTFLKHGTGYCRAGGVVRCAATATDVVRSTARSSLRRWVLQSRWRHRPLYNNAAQCGFVDSVKGFLFKRYTLYGQVHDSLNVVMRRKSVSFFLIRALRTGSTYSLQMIQHSVHFSLTTWSCINTGITDICLECDILSPLKGLTHARKVHLRSHITVHLSSV
jgi:hypothetical protein